jgi:hypothetical protein
MKSTTISCVMPASALAVRTHCDSRAPADGRVFLTLLARRPVGCSDQSLVANTGPSAVPTRPHRPNNPARAYGPPFQERSSAEGVQPRSATPLGTPMRHTVASARALTWIDTDRLTPRVSPSLDVDRFYGKPLTPRTGTRCGATSSASRTTGTWRHSSPRLVQTSFVHHAP